MSQLTVLLNPEQRAHYLEQLLRLDGLGHIKEDPKAAYCPISLTQTPDILRPFLQKRQDQLKDILQSSGITPFDPATSPHNPHSGTRLTSPQVVYNHDTAKILGARFFSGHNLLPSTGAGNEYEKARIYNRIAVIFLDKHFAVSRMQPFRTIYLEYHRFEDHQEDVKKIFQILQEFEPGMGFSGETPVLLGFHKHSGEVVDLENLIYTRFPAMQYKYNGEVPILKLRAENPELFYEYESK